MIDLPSGLRFPPAGLFSSRVSIAPYDRQAVGATRRLLNFLSPASATGDHGGGGNSKTASRPEFGTCDGTSLKIWFRKTTVLLPSASRKAGRSPRLPPRFPRRFPRRIPGRCGRENAACVQLLLPCSRR